MNKFIKSFIVVFGVLMFFWVYGWTCFYYGVAYKKHFSHSNVLSSSLIPQDSVETGWSFSSNSITIPISCFSSQNVANIYSNDYSFLNFSVDIGFDTNGLYCSYKTNSIYCEEKNVVFVPVQTAPNYSPVTTTFYFTDSNWHDFWQFFGYSGVNHFVTYRFDSGFGSTPISYISITKNLSGQMHGRYSGSEVRFYDGNDKCLNFQFMFSNASNQADFVPVRNIYLIDNLSDNQYYDAGYDSGYNAGSTAGYDSGYNAGYSSGYSIGDTAGYDRGLNAVNRYTFNNLFGAMFDVPVHIFTGLLNFNFLGVNLFEFATGIITFVLVVRIVGFILGKK